MFLNVLEVFAGGFGWKCNHAEKQPLRVGDVAGGGTKCQRWHDILLGDRCRVKGVRLARLGKITGRA